MYLPLTGWESTRKDKLGKIILSAGKRNSNMLALSKQTRVVRE